MINFKRGNNLTKAERIASIKNFASHKDITDKKLKVCFYGRVSTEHEAQLAALASQMQWYDDQLKYHKNWVLVDRYIDKGITGTQANKRDEFLRMLADAKLGKFDLIVTREVCRFARNAAQTLDIVEDLGTSFVEVFFVSDGIWSFEPDSLVRLGIMATLAQDESRKTSERVRAGQKISRDNAVLYGNGNILGYKKVDKTYAIDEKQAATVRRIYELYLTGIGYLPICRILEKEGRECANLTVSWTVSKISRILSNTTYKGVLSYGKSISTGYLHQERIVVTDIKEHQQTEIAIPKIIDTEMWCKVEEIRNSRQLVMNTEEGNANKRRGKNRPKDLWSRKLVCNCGSSLRKDKWRVDKNGDAHYGYKCYKQLNDGSLKTREESGLSTANICNASKVADWKIDMIAKLTIEQIWTNRKVAVIKAYEILLECYTDGVEDHHVELTRLKRKIENVELKVGNLIKMRAGDEISKEQFFMYKQPFEKDLDVLKAELERLELKGSKRNTLDMNKELAKIKKVFEKSIDFKQPVLPVVIVDYFIKRVIVGENQMFEVDVNFDGLLEAECKQLPKNVLRSPLFEYSIDYNTAKKYVDCKKGMLRVSQWVDDISVSTYILILES